jgi:hypothetical protein
LACRLHASLLTHLKIKFSPALASPALPLPSRQRGCRLNCRRFGACGERIGLQTGRLELNGNNPADFAQSVKLLCKQQQLGLRSLAPQTRHAGAWHHHAAASKKVQQEQLPAALRLASKFPRLFAEARNGNFATLRGCCSPPKGPLTTKLGGQVHCTMFYLGSRGQAESSSRQAAAVQ